MKSVKKIAALTVAILLTSYAIAGDKSAKVTADSKPLVIYGATGRLGSVILDEALDRGYKVIAVSRNPARLTVDHSNLTSIKGDLTNPESVKEISKGAKAVIVSVGSLKPGLTPTTTISAKASVSMVKAFTGDANAPRVLQMGGASSMGATLDEFNATIPPFMNDLPELVTMIRGHFVVLDNYRASSIKWTSLSPADDILGWAHDEDVIVDGETSRGSYKTSTTGIVKDANGKSEIQVRDLAKAMIDEVENGKFIRQQFSVGY